VYRLKVRLHTCPFVHPESVSCSNFVLIKGSLNVSLFQQEATKSAGMRPSAFFIQLRNNVSRDNCTWGRTQQRYHLTILHTETGEVPNNTPAHPSTLTYS
jgi:hypothetical protein